MFSIQGSKVFSRKPERRKFERFESELGIAHPHPKVCCQNGSRSFQTNPLPNTIMRIMCDPSLVQRLVSVIITFLLAAVIIQAQSTRPRRANRQTSQKTSSPASDQLLRPEPEPSPTARRTSPNDPLLDVQPVKPVVNTVAPADTKHAYMLLEQKQFAAAAKEAKELAESHPNDSEAWKIAGFAELNLKQYADAATHLEKALELQRRSKDNDPNTVNALAQAYVLSEK